MVAWEKAMTNAAAWRCLEKATEMERLAEQAATDETRSAYHRLAENWRFLAENHRRIASMDRTSAERGSTVLEEGKS